ncbi:Gfo/Idh/MocA family protein [Frondihabitans cladoniiphilus]|uniref:Gfo/Idh/MocA family oxidoreductase n=1 Tax=Frondihabitans cladoniiphilus TaxID=715785 RepID=A0ABP8VHW4_9MICO
MTATGPVGIGFIGAGNISTQYFDNLTKFEDVRVLFVADLIAERAEAAATKYGIPGWGTVDELLAIDEIEIVVNLTLPASHAEVGRQVIAAGKSVWSEKPLALEADDAASLLKAASDAGVRVACAPDTVLGAGIQTALRAIARGDIGEPLTATTLFQVPGPNSWHPDPEFLFAYGAGPLFDMGPYYVTTLVHAFGSAERVQAVSSKSHETRVIGSGPRAGTEFPVEVPTHHAALISFEAGQSAASTFSFQQALPRAGFVEITGTDGTLVLPDPNTFEGDSKLWRFGEAEPTTIAAEGSTWGRGTGIVDLARSIRSGTPERATGAIASHVLDVLLAIRDSAASGDSVTVASSITKPEPLEASFDPAARTL